MEFIHKNVFYVINDLMSNGKVTNRKLGGVREREREGLWCSEMGELGVRGQTEKENWYKQVGINIEASWEWCHPHPWASLFHVSTFS